MTWELHHMYRFICTKCNVEISYRCPKCKFQLRIDEIPLRERIVSKTRQRLFWEFGFNCTKCNVEMTFTSPTSLEKTQKIKIVYECPKCKHRVGISYIEDKTLY